MDPFVYRSACKCNMDTGFTPFMLSGRLGGVACFYMGQVVLASAIEIISFHMCLSIRGTTPD